MLYFDDWDPCDGCDYYPDGCEECMANGWIEEISKHQREEAIAKGDDPVIFSEDLLG